MKLGKQKDTENKGCLSCIWWRSKAYELSAGLVSWSKVYPFHTPPRAVHGSFLRPQSTPLLYVKCNEAWSRNGAVHFIRNSFLSFLLFYQSLLFMYLILFPTVRFSSYSISFSGSLYCGTGTNSISGSLLWFLVPYCGFWFLTVVSISGSYCGFWFLTVVSDSLLWFLVSYCGTGTNSISGSFQGLTTHFIKPINGSCLKK
jgi:hypothetical protein